MGRVRGWSMHQTCRPPPGPDCSRRPVRPRSRSAPANHCPGSGWHSGRHGRRVRRRCCRGAPRAAIPRCPTLGGKRPDRQLPGFHEVQAVVGACRQGGVSAGGCPAVGAPQARDLVQRCRLRGQPLQRGQRQPAVLNGQRAVPVIPEAQPAVPPPCVFARIPHACLPSRYARGFRTVRGTTPHPARRIPRCQPGSGPARPMAHLPAGEYALLLRGCVAHKSDRSRAAGASTRTWRLVPMPRDGYRPRYRRGTARTGAAVVLALAATLLAGCSAEQGPPTLTWYINPDAGGQAAIAKNCTDAAGGSTRSRPRCCPTTPRRSASSWSAGSRPATPRSTS